MTPEHIALQFMRDPPFLLDVLAVMAAQDDIDRAIVLDLAQFHAPGVAGAEAIPALLTQLAEQVAVGVRPKGAA